MARRRRQKSSPSGGLLGTGLVLLLAIAFFGQLFQAITAVPLLGVPGLILTLIGLGAIVVLIASRTRSKAKTLADLLALTPGQFEDATANLLRDLGYRDVKRTGGAGDLNVDVSATDTAGQSIAIQCKQYSPGHNVGSPEVQTFIGMIYQHHRAANGIFVTTSKFSAPAMKLAQDNKIALWDGDELARRLQQVRARASAGPRGGGQIGRVWAYGSLPLGLLLLGGAWVQSSQPVAAPATAAPTALMQPLPTAHTASIATATPVPTSRPAASPTATPSLRTEIVKVANTGGEGVYLRRTPNMDDKVRAYQDGTQLTILGPDVVNGGTTWRHVLTPDQAEGYVPSSYVQPTS